MNIRWVLIIGFLILLSACKKTGGVTRNTVTLQPTNNPYEVELGILASGADYSNPDWQEIDAVSWTLNGETLNERDVLRFDLSMIPQKATIDSASITLYTDSTPLNGNLVDANLGVNNALYIQQITSSWDSTVRWANQPTTNTVGEISLPSTALNFLDLQSIDVTEMVSNMVSSNANYGFMIRLQVEQAYNSRIFCSSKFNDATKHPKLVVGYHY